MLCRGWTGQKIGGVEKEKGRVWVGGKQWLSLEENEGIKFIGAMGAGKYGTPHISTFFFIFFFLSLLGRFFGFDFPTVTAV